ncbi:MAG: 50S ribosomal protein L23 [Patescibacteria group bacterium]|nr:50S ribosomal protein L23 [Patescibacteria group bacterium]
MGILDKISKKKDKGDVRAEKKAAQPKSSSKVDGKKEVKKTREHGSSVARSPKGDAATPSVKQEPSEKKPKGSEKKESRVEAAFAYGIISHPVSTEKTDRLQMQYGKYTFMVRRGANKVEIARAVRELYGVTPVSVRVMNLKGKKVRYGRLQGRRKDTRKAVVTLKEGDSISVAE